MAGNRHEVILAAKFSNVRDAEGRSLGVNGRPEYVRSCCDASLRHLGVDVVEFYYQHPVDTQVAQGDHIVPIPGTKRRSYLGENLAALAVELTRADLVELDQAFPPGAAAGMRYPEEHESREPLVRTPLDPFPAPSARSPSSSRCWLAVGLRPARPPFGLPRPPRSILTAGRLHGIASTPRITGRCCVTAEAQAVAMNSDEKARKTRRPPRTA